MSSNFAYRPAIDGLRAIAVLSVFVFHLDHQWLPGGFVGVDVFFVISGFLISSIILADCDKGRFSLLRFYQRRISRIFPVFFAVAVATVIAASMVYSEQDLASAGANLVAAALSLTNVKYMLQSSYFDVSEDAQPFLHYWSLAVEEQFYLVYPFVLFVLYTKLRRWAIPLLTLAFAASFALCVGVTLWRPTWAFYLLPTRGWELLAGCLLALLTWNRPSLVSNKTGGTLALIGLAMVLLSFVVVQGGPHFPGAIALLPVIGTTLIIACPPASTSRVERLLSAPPLVAIGKLSYSLYLWHWPVFSITDYALYDDPLWLRLLIKVTLTTALTCTSYWIIENPARRFLNTERRRGLAYLAFALVLAALVPTGNHIRAHFFPHAKPSQVAQGGYEFNPSDEPRGRLLLIGDSNAAMYGWVVRDVARELNWSANIIALPAANPIPSAAGPDPDEWTDALAAASTLRPTCIIYVMSWTAKLSDNRDTALKAIQELSAHTDRLVLLAQPPQLPQDATRDAIREGARPPFFEDEHFARQRRDMNAFLHSLERDGLVVIDTESAFLLPDHSIRFADETGRFLYQDTKHLGARGSRRLHQPLLKAVKGE